MKALFQKIHECIQQKQPVALAMVISCAGSIPTSQQAKMLVFPDGSIMGTIGGGKLEAEVIRAAQHSLAQESAASIQIHLDADQIDTDGLICGGRVEIFLEPFVPGMPMTPVHEIAAAYSASQPAIVTTLLNARFARPGGNRKILVHPDGVSVGTVGHDVVDVQIASSAYARIGQETQGVFFITVPEEIARKFGIFPETQLKVFFETVLPVPTAYLFGGGHIALHLTPILHLIGFEFVVIDDRAEFANPARFPQAEACLVHHFDNVFAELPENLSNAYLIIITRGHKCDLNVLEQAIRTNAKYIGMIGSTRKIAIVLQHLRDQGVSQAMIETIHAPIGVKIGADTPEEIAVSIAAELIQVRRNMCCQ
ncbi:xanthine and CO dehydrogenases maturation factor [Candidatus Vecturithrix granuli]|uniref:Xanthine and CO dehydrogenases maturation factor n=1 Tax=Vecturithrix granuli TaxID=1499967 RepID=A0A081BZH9_VECG1|nr:xanthine and CO dehydrogenases maturation factor [Candidatus Vecturithrix granuli]